MSNVYESVGLYPYPNAEGSDPYLVPWNSADVPSHPMGTTLIERKGAVGVTFACVSCHAGQMFGRPIIGMPNRFPRTSEFFLQGIALTSKVPPAAFRLATGATAAETQMYKETADNLRFIEALPQRAPGLDTPLAQVALSLSHREPGGSAAKTATYAKRPREEALRHEPSDTKPGTWWNVRYKNRWLLDGSVVSGIPILTNLLWNEIGRGADLNTVSAWIRANPRVIAGLTTAVFRSEPPPINDFFPPERFDLAAARRVQQHFLEYCASCHGVYQKAWDQPGGADLPKVEQMRTLQVSYHARTPVIDVGTDPAHHRAMRSLEQLNRLNFSREFGIRVQSQTGYVPPPLIGIWLRYPYLHNNSVSSLCELLTPSQKRAKRYIAVEAEEEDRDFDFDCNGYPKTDAGDYTAAPKAMRFDTDLPGLSNQGHDQGIFMLGDEEWLSAADKSDLISFLRIL